MKIITKTSVLASLAVLLCAAGEASAQPQVTWQMVGNQVRIDWTAVAGATLYDINVSGTLSGDISIPTTYAQVAAPAGTYVLRVRGRNGGTVGPYSNPVTIVVWQWTYDVVGSSTLKDPPPFLFPTLGREAYYTVKLLVTNLTLNCSDSARKTLTVLDHCFIDVPTAFTPNNDGRNDHFRPHNALKANNYEFRVYNRWGQLVFQSRNWQDKWDGRINGALQGTGTFVWMLSYTHRDTKQPVFKKGTVTLIR